MTANEVHVAVLRQLPQGAPTRGFLRMVNWCVEKIRDRGQWKFDFARGYLDVPASYSTGTVSVTNGDATVTGSGTAWNTNSNAAAGRIMSINGVEYVISSITSDTELELTATFGGTTASAQSYIVYQTEFSLASDCVTVERVWDLTNNCELRGTSHLALKSRAVDWEEAGRTIWYAELGEDASANRRIMISPYPSAYARLEYWYEAKHTKVTDIGDTIDLPNELDELVIQGVYSRALEIARVQTWTSARREFNEMLEARWTKDKLLLDVVIRNERSGRNYRYPSTLPVRFPTQIVDS